MRLLGLLGRLPVPVLFVIAGWYGGARLGAPEAAIDAVDGAAGASISFISGLINRDGEADGEPAAPQDAAEETSGAEEMIDDTQVAFDGPGLELCDLKISNAPPADASGRVRGYKPLVEINGVALLLAPATKSCLSSGFGHRGYSPHRGVDYFSDQGGDVVAAADGVIREAKYRDDYGNMIVIDHGEGVYTRYAHLAGFAASVREGGGVKKGQRLGPIGDTGRAGATHLHYEIRTGDYSIGGSFALTPVDPFSLKAPAN